MATTDPEQMGAPAPRATPTLMTERALQLLFGRGRSGWAAGSYVVAGQPAYDEPKMPHDGGMQSYTRQFPVSDRGGALRDAVSGVLRQLGSTQHVISPHGGQMTVHLSRQQYEQLFAPRMEDMAAGALTIDAVAELVPPPRPARTHEKRKQAITEMARTQLFGHGRSGWMLDAAHDVYRLRTELVAPLCNLTSWEKMDYTIALYRLMIEAGAPGDVGGYVERKHGESLHEISIPAERFERNIAPRLGARDGGELLPCPVLDVASARGR